jgi:hypothetical protein
MEAVQSQAPPAGPTFQEVAEELIETELREKTTRVNVFADCVKDGQVTVQTEAHASEIARMINRARRELEDVQAIAAAMVARAEQRVKNLEFLFMTPLEIWTSAQVAGKKTRSLILEGGKLALRKVPSSVRTEDADALLAWAKEGLPDAIEMVPKVKTDVVKAWEVKEGKVAPGRVVTPERDSFTVSVPK